MVWDAVAQSPRMDYIEKDNFRSRDKQLSTSLFVEMCGKC